MAKIKKTRGLAPKDSSRTKGGRISLNANITLVRRADKAELSDRFCPCAPLTCLIKRTALRKLPPNLGDLATRAGHCEKHPEKVLGTSCLQRLARPTRKLVRGSPQRGLENATSDKIAIR